MNSVDHKYIHLIILLWLPVTPSKIIIKISHIVYTLRILLELIGEFLIGTCYVSLGLIDVMSESIAVFFSLVAYLC